MHRGRRPRVRRGVRAVVLCLVAMGVSRPAAAAPIDLDTWYQFSFFQTGVPVAGCDPADPAGDFCTPSSGTPTSFAPAPDWTFVAPGGGATLTVVDAFQSGDRFAIFDFGVALGPTSLPVIGADCGDDPIDCLASVDHSVGVFSLAPGAHALSFMAILAPSESGSAYFQVAAASVEVVPEPTTMMLIASGLAALLVRRRAMGRTP